MILVTEIELNPTQIFIQQVVSLAEEIASTEMPDEAYDEPMEEWFADSMSVDDAAEELLMQMGFVAQE